MSNEPEGPAPVPDPFAPPEPAATAPVPSSGNASPPSGYGAVPPSGYEAVRTPVGETAPTAPYLGPPSASSPYVVPTPAEQQPGTGPAPAAYGAPQYGAPQQGAPPYGAPQQGAPAYGAPQYGAPQYGAAQYGAPAYGQAQAPYGAQPYPQPYASPPTEGMAIASFVTSTAGLFFLGGLPGPVGIGLGIAALRRIKVSGKAGRGFAIAGIAVGAVGVLAMLAVAAYIVFIIVVVAGSAGSSSNFWDDVSSGIEESQDGPTGSTDPSSELPDYTLRTDLTVGTCLTTYPLEYDMADTDPVDCAVPHEAEVVGVITMSGAVALDLDANDPAFDDAWAECDQLTEGLLPSYYAEGSIDLYYPHPDDFATGITSAYCVYYGDVPGITGSAVTRTLQLAGLES